MKNVIQEQGCRPVKIWTDDIEDEALTQAKNLARLPFIAGNGVALMPDVHAGKGSTVGSVIATDKAIIPAAVGVDIGCGMNAVRLSLKASDLPDSLASIRAQIERDVPLGAGGKHNRQQLLPGMTELQRQAVEGSLFGEVSSQSREKLCAKAATQLGTLGSGNHFIELCIDENQDVWVMLHSGSRGIGNMIGSYFIEKAKRRMEQYFIHLPDGDLAYIPEDTDDFKEYMAAVEWARERGVEEMRFPADWNTHGKKAGPIRNQQMLDQARPDGVIAFPGGVGTADMVSRAENAGVTVWMTFGRLYESQ